MREPPHHYRLRHDAVFVKPTDRNQIITGYLNLRRRLDHAPIPSFDDYVGCKARKRLDNDEFARLYGASDEDIAAVKAHYATIGFHSIEHHAAARMIHLTGEVHHFNTAFHVTLNDYEHHLNGHILHSHAHADVPMVPDNLHDKILEVKFDDQPIGKPAAFFPPVVGSLTPATVMSIYNCPTAKALNQTVAIPTFNGGGDFLDSDTNATCDLYSVAHPTVTRITINAYTDTTGGAETTLDVAMIAVYGEGAAIAVYKTFSFNAFISRVAHPIAGDPVCSIMSISYTTAEVDNNDTALADAAIQGITVFGDAGDWGTTDGSVSPPTVGTVTALYPPASPHVTAVGGTIIGTNTGVVSKSNFVEWAWNDNGAFFQVGGGGVSVIFAQPSFQTGITIPATVSTVKTPLNGSAGRGYPDIAANASPSSGIPIKFNGGTFTGNGTSMATPTYAGMFARVNSLLGHNVGYINPTLYSGASNFMRNVNSGGATNNALSNPSGGFYPSYVVTLTGWNPVVGLGMVNVTNFLNFVRLAGAAPGSFFQDFTLLSTNVVESANQTSVTTNGPLITAFDSNTYALGGTNGAVLVNGAADATTSNAQRLYYLNHYVYYQATNGIWLTKKLLNDAWVQTWDPVIQIADAGKQYFINSSTGNDNNTGKAANLAFATFAQFASVAGPGTVANVAGNTTYTAGAFFASSASGTDGHRCVIQWDGIGAKPIINLATTDGNGFVVQANWFDIIGIVVQGTNQQVTFQQAKDFATAGQSPNICNQIGFNYGQRGNRITQHHVRVMNCEFYDCGASGININFADYVVVVNNIVARCSWYSIFGSSGISIYGSHDFDTVTVYKTYVANNICYENQQKVPTNGGTDYTASGITDGENIILDDNSNDQTDSVAYIGRTLVVGNQCSLSGRSNIEAFAGSNADILFNTCYGANQVVSTDGEIYMHNYSGTNHVENNILYATTAGDSTIKIDAGSGTTSDFNLHFTTGTASATNTGTHDVTGQDPLFTDIANRNFKVGSTSPARNKADPVWCYNVMDAAGISRPRLNATLGAYQ